MIEVFASYWKFAQTYYRKGDEPTNEIDALRIVMRDAKRLFGHDPAEDFGPKKLKAVRQLWIDRGQARSTVNKNMRRLTRIFRWAATEELITGSMLPSLQAVPGLKKGRCSLPEPDPIEPVSLAIVQATIPNLPSVTRDMVRFQMLTGARPGEVCRMRPKDIDRSGDVWEYNDADHKTVHHGQTRTVFIGPEAQAVLTPYLLRDAEKVCFSMAESLEQRRQIRSDARVTPIGCGNRRGKRYQSDRTANTVRRTSHDAFNAGTYRNAIHAACDLAFPAPEPLCQQQQESNAARWRRLNNSQREELADWQRLHRWSPNQIRHTRATEIRRQFGIEAAQVILGHAACDVTQIYAERDRDKAREVARAIG